MKMITQDRLKELLNFNENSGLFTWNVRRCGRAEKGAIAGSTNAIGYIQIQVDGKNYLAHRLAWLYIHGVFPTSDIDHINGNRADNRLANLREATRSENKQNQRNANCNNSSGTFGATWHKQTKKWKAQIMLNGKNYHIGLYDTKEEAHMAYKNAKLELHPFSTL